MILALQIIVLIALAFVWFGVTFPPPPHKAWNFWGVAAFFLLLSFMIAGQAWLQLHPVH